MKTLSDTEPQSAVVTKRNPAFLFDTIKQSTPYTLLKQALLESCREKEAVMALTNISGLQGSLSSILAAAAFY